ncbi:hypothetical protein [Nitrosomonas sp.]|uniref:hypothetical protein n=1 Tax=Nitrosomonas sp. TaxID=42353 RepID=UPI001D4CA4C4|nr:hypothetical protein [Nitrosomonas sp.]MCB1949633.1 hypothetical protein [Nitrosomonas sp.]
MPSHIHSPEKMAAAEKVQNELNSYAENAPAMYKAMISNLEKFRIEEERVINDLLVNREEALINQLPTIQLNQLQIKIDGEKGIRKNIEKLEEFIFEETINYLKNEKIFSTDIKNAKKAIQQVQKAVDSAESDVTNWNASIALLKKGILALMSESSTEEQQSVDKILTNIGDEEVEFIDAKGNLVKAKIKKILENRLPKNSEEMNSFGIPDAPGNTLIILKLGLEFAEIEKDEAVARLLQLASRAELFEDIYGGVKLADQLIVDVVNSVSYNNLLKVEQSVERHLMDLSIDGRRQYNLMNNSKTSRNDSYVISFQKLHETQQNISSLLTNLRYLYLADLIVARADALYKLSSARLDHRESILTSQINDRKYLAALTSISDSLVVFHRGGFTREDASDIINIAQAIAVAVLAGRI